MYKPNWRLWWTFYIIVWVFLAINVGFLVKDVVTNDWGDVGWSIVGVFGCLAGLIAMLGARDSMRLRVRYEQLRQELKKFDWGNDGP